LHGFADSHVNGNLFEPWNCENVLNPKLFLESWADRFNVMLVESSDHFRVLYL
jgi:hypothetical protein